MRIGTMSFVGAKLPQSQQMLHTEEEARTTDAAHENSDLHIDRD